MVGIREFRCFFLGFFAISILQVQNFQAAVPVLSLASEASTTFVYHGTSGFGEGLGFGQALTTFTELSTAIDSEGDVHVAYGIGNNQNNKTAVYVRQWDGSSWSGVGSSQPVTDGGRRYTLLIGSDDIPYLSYLAESNSQYSIPEVLKFDGNDWVEAGTGLNFTANSMAMALDETNVPHIAVAVLTASDGAVYKLVNGAWVAQGSPSFTIWDGGAGRIPGMAFNGSDLYLSHISDTDDGLSVRKWDGSNWTLVGSENFVSAAQRSSLVVTSGGGVYVGYERDPNCEPMMGPCMEYKSKVSRWDGTNWVEMISFDAGGVGFSTESTLLRKDANENLLLGYTGFGFKPSVMQFNGTTWTAVLTSPYQTVGASPHVFAVHSDNTLYTVFGDGSLNNNPSVKTVGLGGSKNSTSVVEGLSVAGTLTATDADAHSITSFSISGGADQGGFQIHPTSGVLSFTTAPDFENPTDLGDTAGNNTYTVEVTATDSNSESGILTVTVSVLNVDEGPVATKPSDITTDEDFQPDIQVSLRASDQDGDIISFSAQISDSTIASVNVSGSTLSISPVANGSGEATITVTATANGKTDTTTFSITVNSVNDAPTFVAEPPSSSTTFVYFGIPGFGEGEAFGGDFSSSGLSMALDSSGAIYVAYGIINNQSHANSIYVRKWDGATWAAVGASQPVTDGGRSFTLAIGTDDIPYIAYLGEMNQQYAIPVILKFDGADWVQAGTGINFTANSLQLALDENNVPHIAVAILTQSDGAVYKLSNGIWDELGSPNFIIWDGGSGRKPGMIFDGSDLYLSHISSNNDALSVRKFDGTTWSLVGSENFADSAQNSSLVLTSGDGLFVAYETDPNCMMTPCMEYQSKVRRFDGTNWTEVISFTGGGIGFSTDATLLKKDANENLLLGFVGQGFAPSVMSHNGTTWSAVVTAPYQAGTASSHTFAVHSDNTLYTAFLDFSNNSNPSVKTVGLGGGAVNPADQSTSVLEGSSIAMSLRATDVDGDSLSYSVSGGVDSSAFSIDTTSGTLSFVTPPDFENPTDQGDTAGNNTYVVEITADDSNGGTAISTVTVTILDKVEPINAPPVFTAVKPSGGTTFTIYGTPGFGEAQGGLFADKASSGQVSLDVDSNSEPFVAYGIVNPNEMDMSRKTSIYVRSWDGNTWAGIGASQPVTDNGQEFILRIASNDTPYLAYLTKDMGGQVSFPQVLKFDGQNWVQAGTGLDLSGFGAAAARLQMENDENGVLYLSLSLEGQKPDVYMLDNGTWELQGSPDFNLSGTPNFAIEDGIVYLTGITDTSGPDAWVSVRKYDGTTWSVIGAPQLVNFAFDHSLVALSNNRLFLAVRVPDCGTPPHCNGYAAKVYEFSGAQWDEFGNFSEAGGFDVLHVEIRESPFEELVLSFTSGSAGMKEPSVFTFDGTTWTAAVTSPYQNELVSGHTIAIGSDNTLFTAFHDGNRANNVTVKTFGLGGPAPDPMNQTTSVLEGTSIAITLKATDAEGDSLIFSVSGGADQAAFEIGSSTGVLSFTTPPDFGNPIDLGDTAGNNTYVVEVTADDSNGGTSVATVTVTVIEGVDPPVLSTIPTQHTSEDFAPISISLQFVGQTTGTVSASTDNPTLAGVFPFMGNLFIQAQADQFGSATITLTSTNEGGTTTTSFELIVDPVNDAPLFKLGDGWLPVGMEGFAGPTFQEISIAFDSHQRPYIGFNDFEQINNATNSVSVMKFDGTTWTAVGDRNFPGGPAEYASLVLDSNDQPYLAYVDQVNQGKATVMTYNGTAWVPVGAQGISNTGVGLTSLAIDSSDTLYLAYRNHGPPNKVSVKKFDGQQWVSVGSEEFSQGSAEYLSLKVNSQGIPYIAYQDGANSQKLTVMKLNSQSQQWEEVGSKAFSDGSALWGTLAFDDSDTPYVGYADGARSLYQTVMKFNSQNDQWESVGEKGFSQADGGFVSFDVGPGNVPYIAFADNTFESQGRISAWVYDGSKWKQAGKVGFNDGAPIQSTGLRVNGNKVPYTAFLDGGNNSKITVMRLSKGDKAPSVVEGTSEAVTLKATDVEGDSITFSISGGEDSAGFEIGGSSGLLAFKNPPDYENPTDLGDGSGNNTYVVEISADDSLGGISLTTITVTVTDGPEPPSLSTIPSQETTEDFAALLINLGSSSLTYSTTIDNSSLATVELSDTALVVMPLPNQNGSATVTVTATNSLGSDTTTFTVTIHPVNDPPTFDSEPPTILRTFVYVGEPGFGEGEGFLGSMQSGEIDFALGPNSTPYVAYVILTSNPATRKIYVRRWDGQEWIGVGPQPATDAGQHPSLEIDSQGIPYLAFLPFNNFQATSPTILKLDGNTWVSAGTGIEFTANSLQLALDSQDVPYIASAKLTQSDALVHKLVNGVWTMQGSLNAIIWDGGQGRKPGLLVDDSGNIYLSHQDGFNEAISVHKYDGTTWTSVGPREFASSIRQSRLVMDSTGKLYVSFEQGENCFDPTMCEYQPKVQFFNGQSWENLGELEDQNGGGGFPGPAPGAGGGVDQLEIKLDSNDQVYAGYFNFGGPVLKKWDGTNWMDVTTSPYIPQGTLYHKLEITPSNKIYTAFSDSSHNSNPSVMTIGTAGGSGESTTFTSNVLEGTSVVMSLEATDVDGDSLLYSVSGGADEEAFEITQSTGILSFKEPPDFENPIDLGDTAGNNTYVVEVTADDSNGGTAKTTVTVTVLDGEEPPEISTIPSQETTEDFDELRISLDLTGASTDSIDLIASIEPPGSGTVSFDGHTLVLHLNENFSGEATITLTATGQGGSSTTTFSITVDPVNDPPAITNPRGSSFQNFGAGLSDGTASQISLVFDSNDTPYMVFEDSGNSQGASLMKFNGTEWVLVGEKNFTGGYGLYLPLDFGPGGEPYVGFLENFNSNKATVMKFDGTEWVVVGNRGFNADNSFYFDMALDSKGTPYVVFKDGSKNKGSVM
jgi:hypothetical protein